MPHVRRRRPVFTREVIWVRRDGAQAIRITHGLVQYIEAKKGKTRVHPGVHVGDQLILVIQSRGFHQKNGPCLSSRLSKGKHAASRNIWIVRARQRCIDVVRPQFVQTVRIRISHRQRSMSRQLALHRHRRLHDIRRAQVRADFLNRLRSGLQSLDRRNIGEEIRIGYHELLLNLSVVTIGRQSVRQREAIVKDSVSRADHRLRLGIRASRSRCPRDRNARCEIPPVMNIALCLVAQTGAHRDVRPYPPIVAHERSHVHLMQCQLRHSRIDRKLAGPTAHRADFSRRISLLLQLERLLILLD